MIWHFIFEAQDLMGLRSEQIPFLYLGRLKTVSFIIASLGLVAQSVEQRIENPCVGGSIPPRATKNLNSPLVGLFSFRAWQDSAPLVLETTI